MNLTQYAIEGYQATSPCPHIKTSPAEMAWSVGRWMAQTGRTMPRDCRSSRGYTMHINDMKVKINHVDGRTEIERIA